MVCKEAMSSQYRMFAENRRRGRSAEEILSTVDSCASLFDAIFIAVSLTSEPVNSNFTGDDFERFVTSSKTSPPPVANSQHRDFFMTSRKPLNF